MKVEHEDIHYDIDSQISWTCIYVSSDDGSNRMVGIVGSSYQYLLFNVEKKFNLTKDQAKSKWLNGLLEFYNKFKEDNFIHGQVTRIPFGVDEKDILSVQKFLTTVVR